MKIGIHSRSMDPSKSAYILNIVKEIALRENVETWLSAELIEYITSSLPSESLPTHIPFVGYDDLGPIDILVSIGGDGTLLHSLTMVRERHIPILGINAGRLGFLATTSKDKVKTAVDALLNGYYTIEQRSMIALESNIDVFDGLNFGLNEFTILKRDTSSMIQVNTYLDGEYLNSYWSDGLIVSTPTGSTGYSLSVGGPVVMPNTGNFIIAPVCPHNLNVRPLVVSDSSVISFQIEGRSRNFLVSLDSRSKKVDDTVKLAVRKCPFYANLVKFNEDNFLSTLRLKLNWGIDARN
ncbi:NAD kinase [Algivirga pacifica]|uniref:NAD kinase n=1 Tax=Algivirga pacifica TaxID=1162670 RepID=A0ABP9DCF5_9BACT